jgi:tRNA(Ile)-lysidine synthetase-like protein
LARPTQTLLKSLKDKLPRNVKLLVAVSGGVDSVAMLDACTSLKALLKISLEVVHVNHNLRAESDSDAEFVQNLAAQYGLPFHLRSANPPPQGVNIEAWARGVRYEFFKQILDNEKIDFVITAHTADDVAETLLMRLIANKEPRSIMPFDQHRRLIRPILGVSRLEIEGYAEEKELNWVTDDTNFDLKLLRNRVRHIVMPLLREKFDQRISEVLQQRATAIADDIAYLDSLAASALARTQERPFGSSEWLAQIKVELARLDRPLQWRFIEKLLKPKLGFNLGRQKGVALVAFFLMDEPEEHQISATFVLRIRDGAMVIENNSLQ